ncbi:MAG: hypothetical protein AAGK92_03150 [Pseudomonadota bacterium]
MKYLTILAALVALSTPVFATFAEAGPITRACMQSDRKAASRSLCNCIQKAANTHLSRGDQRLAASFFKDPHKAQEIRQSDRRSHETFWKKYRAFGSTAETYCRRS